PDGVLSRLADVGGVETERGDRLSDTRARRVPPRQQLCAGLADQRPAADERHAEAHALLLGESDDFNLQLQTPARQKLYKRDAKHDAEDPIEGARVGNGIEV